MMCPHMAFGSRSYMIEIYYYYYRKDHTTGSASQTFTSIVKAIRFLYAMKKNPRMYIIRWACDDPYDNEILSRKFSLTEINSKGD